ncbi:B3/4 domain-containing protein [Hathewaya histolytica]|uniref:B3/B4 domain-containing protein n=1 Tax=Hathewaya histolytica TaxID=1498 RepID=UPI003B66F576
MYLSIDKTLKEVVGGDITLGVVEGTVKVYKSSHELMESINKIWDEIYNTHSLEEVLQIGEIKEARCAYRKLGNDPSRYRVASEALIRRIIKGNGLCEVNNVVDINNLISLKSKLPVCAYNADKINGDITLKKGITDDVYEGIGRGKIKIQNLPVFYDYEGAFGSTTSDSVKTMVDENCENLILIILSFKRNDKIEKYLYETCELLKKFAQGKDLKISMIN